MAKIKAVSLDSFFAKYQGIIYSNYKMKISTKEITDECQHCGDILVCQLCREGHGINRE
nr:MAG TPA: Protein of unknown function (DUF983) [Bacteriophage sp.]